MERFPGPLDLSHVFILSVRSEKEKTCCRPIKAFSVHVHCLFVKTSSNENTKKSESIWPLSRNLTALLRAHRVCTESFLPKICWTVVPISQPVGGQQTGAAPPGGEGNLCLSGCLLSTSHTGWLWFRRPFPRLCQPSWFVCRIWFIAAFSFSEGGKFAACDL